MNLKPNPLVAGRFIELLGSDLARDCYISNCSSDAYSRQLYETGSRSETTTHQAEKVGQWSFADRRMLHISFEGLNRQRLLHHVGEIVVDLTRNVTELLTLRGSELAPILRTPDLRSIMGQERCHGSTTEFFSRVQTRSGGDAGRTRGDSESNRRRTRRRGQCLGSLAA